MDKVTILCPIKAVQHPNCATIIQMLDIWQQSRHVINTSILNTVFSNSARTTSFVYGYKFILCMGINSNSK